MHTFHWSKKRKTTVKCLPPTLKPLNILAVILLYTVSKLFISFGWNGGVVDFSQLAQRAAGASLRVTTQLIRIRIIVIKSIDRLKQQKTNYNRKSRQANIWSISILRKIIGWLFYCELFAKIDRFKYKRKWTCDSKSFRFCVKYRH